MSNKIANCVDFNGVKFVLAQSVFQEIGPHSKLLPSQASGFFRNQSPNSEAN